jgi:competence protein ComEA
VKAISKYIPQLRLFLIVLLTITASIGFALTWQNEVAGSAVTFIREIPSEGTASLRIAYITGAVNKPGVYQIDANTSLGDLIQRAEGFSADVDAEYVSTELNLAKLVEEREHIHIPDQNTKVAATAITTPETDPVAGKVNLNTATQSELEALPGVGPALATNIIAARPFKALIDLQYVKGIGDAKYKQLEPLVSL